MDRFADWSLPPRFRRLISETTAQLDAAVVRDYRPLDQMLGQLVRAPVRYGLTVPSGIGDPVAASGCTPGRYAVRRQREYTAGGWGSRLVAD